MSALPEHEVVEALLVGTGEVMKQVRQLRRWALEMQARLQADPRIIYTFSGHGFLRCFCGQPFQTRMQVNQWCCAQGHVSHIHLEVPSTDYGRRDVMATVLSLRVAQALGSHQDEWGQGETFICKHCCKTTKPTESDHT